MTSLRADEVLDIIPAAAAAAAQYGRRGNLDQTDQTTAKTLDFDEDRVQFPRSRLEAGA